MGAERYKCASRSTLANFCLAGLVVGPGLLGYSLMAWAACPSPYDDDDCEVDLDSGSGVQLVCKYDSGYTEYLCDLTPTLGDNDLTMVSDYSGEYQIEAWGTYGASSQEFCCEADNVDDVRIEGGPYHDDIKLTYSGGAYNLLTADSALVRGNNGPDTINGSDDQFYYTESLYGGAMNDVINGNGGTDNIYGGTGADTLMGNNGIDYIWGEDGDDVIDGGGGDDEIYGGNGNDTIRGGTGVDEIHGEGNIDKIAGGDGGDYIYGEDANDFLCGDDGNDHIDAGGGTNRLWGADTGDSHICNGAGDTWDGNGSGGTCSGASVDTGRPTECPDP